MSCLWQHGVVYCKMEGFPTCDHWFSLLQQNLASDYHENTTQTYHTLHELLQLTFFYFQACLTAHIQVLCQIQKFWRNSLCCLHTDRNSQYRCPLFDAHFQHSTPLLLHCAMAHGEWHENFLPFTFILWAYWHDYYSHWLRTANVGPLLHYAHFVVTKHNTKFLLHNLVP